MQNLNIPAASFEAGPQGHEDAEGSIAHPPTAIKVGREKPQAPTGQHIARCVHVEPNWSFLGVRKVALYFEISEGDHCGKTARRFYNLKRLHDGTFEIAPRSKLLRDISRLFPGQCKNDALDPVILFKDKFFDIEVIRHISKSGDLNSIVNSFTLHDIGF